MRGESVVVEHDKPRVEAGGGLDNADLQVREDDELLGHEAVHSGVPGVCLFQGICFFWGEGGGVRWAGARARAKAREAW